MAEMTIRPAGRADIDLVHHELMDVISTSPFYSERFKAHEKGRLDKVYLQNLLAMDPWHIMIMCADGVPGGAMVSGPEFGAVFRYWSWVFPSHRQTKLGMFGMRAFDQHWDNNRFHKAFTFVRPDNEVARMLLRRYGYRETALLEQHIFGEDYLLIEKFYTKAEDGYDSGVNVGRLGRLRNSIRGLVGG
ncbi:hypothetical protein SAMN05216456_1078 [Devosia crocina]|uniref:N-acetyltransferase domain-containing protein n=1 Tax=Devosia crocina TaxID=429728 RepID=A0A1I7N7Q9_9HYPH|nr:hypothetical protein [Devosia crocina]SFV30623.1 hypothetical protein SAMN05216456_1078 [Devosia crocina]